jgi:hypothetical protein
MMNRDDVKNIVRRGLRRLMKTLAWAVFSYVALLGVMFVICYFLYPDQLNNPELRLAFKAYAFFNLPVVWVLAQGISNGGISVRIVD